MSKEKNGALDMGAECVVKARVEKNGCKTAGIWRYVVFGDATLQADSKLGVGKIQFRLLPCLSPDNLLNIVIELTSRDP